MKENSTPETAKQPQVNSQIELLNSGINSLQNSVGELSKRLNPVLRELEPEAEEKNSEVQQFVPLAYQIEEACGEITSVNECVLDLLKRLEI